MRDLPAVPVPRLMLSTFWLRVDKRVDTETTQLSNPFNNKELCGFGGAAGENRTLDLSLTKGVLYP